MAALREVTQPSKHKVDPRRIDPSTPYLGLEHIEAHTRRIIGQAKAKDAQSAKVVFRAGDVLYGKLRPYLNKVCLPPFDGVCSTDILVFPQRPEIDSRYLMYFLNCPQVVEEMGHAMAGAQLPRVSFDTLGELRFPLPPLAEQQRIADKLETIMSRIQSACDRLGRLPSLLDTVRQAVFAVAVDGRLVDTEPLGSTGSRGWTLLRAQDVCTKVQNGGTPKIGFADSPGVPFLKVYNIVNQKVDFAYKPQFVTDDIHAGPLAKSQTLPGDVLMNIVGPPLGKVAVVPSTYPAWNINQAIALFRPSERVTTEWLYIVLCSGRNVAEVDPETRGIAGQSNISITQCREFLFPVPPIEEQRAIGRRIGDLSAILDRLLSRCDSAARVADSLPSTVSRKAFAGELCETEAATAAVNGTAYESGEQLLARIRSQPVSTTRMRESTYEVSEVSLPRVLIMKKLHEIGKSHLFDLLVKGKKGMTPQELLLASELDVDDFYTQLKREVETKKVKETRKSKTGILLEAAR
jgi:type I restriction enzyme S subunit